LFALLEKRGDRLAADILSEIANDQNQSVGLRTQAATALAPYQHAKFGLVPAAPPLVYIEAPELPHPHVSELTHIVENVEFLSALRHEGKIDQAACDSLVADQRIAGAHLIEHQKAIAAQGAQRDQRIEITGGLPPLPGTAIDFGGTEFAARVAAVQAHPAVVNGERTLEGHITPTTDAIPPDPQRPNKPKPNGDDRA
jgi:hypothetical protein